MPSRQIYDEDCQAQFITFSCYRRRRLLDHELIRDALVEILSEKIQHDKGICSGYVIMPNHVHMIVWFEDASRLPKFMQRFKQSSSILLKKRLLGLVPNYAKTFAKNDPFWQPKYYAFNLYSLKKAEEKLNYMHKNPVKAGLVERAIDWQWSSARHYELNETSLVPLKWVFD